MMVRSDSGPLVDGMGTWWCKKKREGECGVIGV